MKQITNEAYDLKDLAISAIELVLLFLANAAVDCWLNIY